MTEIKTLTYAYILRNNIRSLPLFDHNIVQLTSEDAFFMWLRLFNNLYEQDGYVVNMGDRWSIIGNDLFDKAKELCQKRKQR